MSTNFLQWNPGGANQESDAAYSADVLRTGGATTGAIWGSPVANKQMYQAAIFITAFAQMMVNKGYTVLDSNFANLVAALTNVRCAADFPSAIATVTYATSVAFPAATAKAFDLTLTGNVSSSTISGQNSGDHLLFIFSQDGVGNRAFSWPSGITAPGAICPLASSTSVQYFVVRPSGAIVPITQMVWITAAGIGSPYGPTVVSVSSSGTVSSAYREITEEVNASAGPVTRTFYSASAAYNGWKINIKKMDSSANSVLPTPAGGQLIDGLLTQDSLSQQYVAFTYQCDGTGWIRI